MQTVATVKSESSAQPQTQPLLGDTAGVTASVACAVHCAIMPIIIGYLPAFGLSWIAGPGFHQAMAALCFAAATLAFVPGFKKHGVIWPAFFGSLGVVALTVEAFGLVGPCYCCADSGATTSQLIASQFATLLPPLGGLLLIFAHLLNHRYSCGCCESGHCHPH